MAAATDNTCVLMFHGIGAIGHPLEPGEGDYWIDWPRFDAIVDYCLTDPPRPCVFTFDDGNSSDLEAARRLSARGATGIFFVLAGKIGTPGYLSAQDVRDMAALGMEIGLHGRDHIDWRAADDATLRSEIDESRDAVAALCAAPVTALAIPYGLYDKRVWRYLEKSDFARIYTSDRGLARKVDRFIRRNPIMRDQTLADLGAVVRDDVGVAARVRRTVMPLLKRAV